MNRPELTRAKPYTQILDESIEEGLHQLKRKPSKLFLSSFSAGLDLGFSALLISAFLVVANNISPLMQSLAVNFLYSVGFVLVVVGRSELFTEHTTLSILPILDGKSSLTRLFRVWFIILFGNLSGAFVFAYATSLIGPEYGIIDQQISSHVYHNLLGLSNVLMFMSAVLAGWLMGLLTWLVIASKETISDIVIVILITFSIGFLQLHHSIAGSIEIMLAMFTSSQVSFPDLINFLIWVVLGNTFGGAVFVGLLKYSHASKKDE